MKYTIAKYLRISSEDIDLDGLDKYESNSVAHQRALLDDFISKTPAFAGCEIIETIDDGRSGTNFQRPGVQHLLDLAQSGKIQCIIVKDLSRFGRSYLEVGDYLEQLFPVWGVRFISVTDLYDSAQHIGATGGINIAFRNLIAELYSQDLSDKVRTAKDAINRKGKNCAPYGFYGYIVDPDDHHKLILDEPAAEIVRLIFNLREQGVTSTKIARKLNEDGIQTASERKKEQGAKRDWLKNSKVHMWDKGFITRILSDERYTGKHIYGKLRRVELGKSTVKAVPQSEWIVVPNTIPVIITDEQFKRVREMIQVNASPKSDKAKGVNLPFYHKLFCGACGRALVRTQSSGGYNYSCSTPSVKHGLGCMQNKMRENDVVETTLAVLRHQARLAVNMKLLKLQKNRTSFAEIENLRGEAKNLKKLIDKANATKLSLWEKQQTDECFRETFKSERARLTEQVASYTARISNLESQVRSLELESGQENTFVERFSKQVGIEKLTKEVADEFIKSISVHAPDRVEIILNYADEYMLMQKQMGS